MTRLSDQLRAETSAVRLKTRKLGLRRRLDEPTEQQAASVFGADAEYISASKKLLDNRDQRYKHVTGVLSRAKAYWKAMTVPYPAIKGVRLIRRDQIDAFNQQMAVFREDLASNVKDLVEQFEPLKRTARQMLGQLYKPSDYPAAEELGTYFAVEWSYVSVEPPDHLKQLNPRLYEQEQARVRAEMETALHAAEQAFAAELQSLVGSLCEALSPGEDGAKKRLKPSALKSFGEFFDRFQQVRVGSNSDLDNLVGTAQSLLKGVDPSALKQQADQQQQLFSSMTTIRDTLGTLLIDVPARAINLGDDDE